MFTGLRFRGVGSCLCLRKLLELCSLCGKRFGLDQLGSLQLFDVLLGKLQPCELGGPETLEFVVFPLDFRPYIVGLVHNLQTGIRVRTGTPFGKLFLQRSLLSFCRSFFWGFKELGCSER